MGYQINCPKCKNSISYFSSEIGSQLTCQNCHSKVMAPMDSDAQIQIDKNAESIRKLREKWDNHDHLTDPKPFEDINGFIQQIIKFSKGKGELAKKIEGAGIFCFPPTEDLHATYEKFIQVTAEDLQCLPMIVQNSFLSFRESLRQGLTGMP